MGDKLKTLIRDAGVSGFACLDEPTQRALMFQLLSDISNRVDHPAHYGGADNPFEAIKVIDAWGLGFCLGNTVKYIARAGKKGDFLEDLRKARWYLQHEIEQQEKAIRDAEAYVAQREAQAAKPPVEPRVSKQRKARRRTKRRKR